MYVLFVCLQPDNIMKMLSEKLQPGFLTNRDEFIALLAKEANFKPYGELMKAYKITKGREHHSLGQDIDICVWTCLGVIKKISVFSL